MRYVLSVAAAFLLISSAAWRSWPRNSTAAWSPCGEPTGRCYVGWRLLESDPADVAFHVYRQAGQEDAAQRLTTEPVRESTNFVDGAAPPEGDPRYFVRPRDGRRRRSAQPRGRARQHAGRQSYIAIPLQGDYRVHKVATGDLDGDGRYELIIQQPDFNTDPYQSPGYWKKSKDTYKLEAYSLDGRFLWRHDMGWSIEAGTWYAPYVVYDLDGDGKAEVYCKGGEGDPREPEGHVKTGPGMAVQARRADGPNRQEDPLDSAAARDRRVQLLLPQHAGRRLSRRPAAAFADAARDLPGHRHRGVRPGSETRVAMELARREGEIRQPGALTRFAWPTSTATAATRSSSARASWTTTARPCGRSASAIPTPATWARSTPNGQGCRSSSASSPARRAVRCGWSTPRSGKTLWANEEPTVHVHSQGMCADILAEYPGQECYAGEAKGGEQAWMFTAQGKRIGSENIGSLAPLTLWWDADPQKEIVLEGQADEVPGRDALRLARGRPHREWWPTSWAIGARKW